MLQNYEYFLMLAKEQNISRAAEKLFISHQCLSRYLKTLEDECGLTLFDRKPKFALTAAGHTLANSLLEVQRIEQNLHHELSELRLEKTGEIRLGITEGRLRIIIPDLLKDYQKLYPDIMVKTVSAPSPDMVNLLLRNELDVVVANPSISANANLNYSSLLTEKLYLLISDNLLRQYFHDTYPKCKEDFQNGVDLAMFQHIPFVANYSGFSSRRLLDIYLNQHHITLNIIHEATQPDLLHIMAAKDYAATVCLTMYIPNIWDLNQSNPPDNQLNIFPIKDLNSTYELSIITAKGKYFPGYMKSLFTLLKQQCKYYSRLNDQL